MRLGIGISWYALCNNRSSIRTYNWKATTKRRLERLYWSSQDTEESTKYSWIRI